MAACVGETSEKSGKPLIVEGCWKERMVRAGFRDVVAEVYKASKVRSQG